MKRPSSLQSQLTWIIGSVAAGALALLIFGYALLYWFYDQLVIARMPPAVAAEYNQLNQNSDNDAAAWARINEIFEAYQPISGGLAETLVLLLLGLLCFALALVAARWQARKLAKPVSALAEAAEEVAGRKLSVQAEAGSDAPAEIALLTNSFNKMVAELARHEAGRRESAALIAHELRTPLTRIKGRLQGMRDGVFLRDDKEVGHVLAQVELMERVVEDLRLVTLFEAGQLNLVLVPVDLAALLEAAIHESAPILSSARQTWTTDLPHRLLVNADRIRLSQAVGSILTNAAQHAGPSVHITVSLACENSEAVVSFKDTGRGLPETVRLGGVRRFLKAPDQGEGTGLGLAAANAIVQAHGGRLVLSNSIDGGAVIMIRLPLQDVQDS